MSDYQQPDFYRFNEDSILFTKYLLQQKKLQHTQSILDICAGCGVIGIELAKGFKHIEELTLIELQKDYAPSLASNINQFIPDLNVEIIWSDFEQVTPLKQFDLIVANPPYFEKGKGRVSTNVARQRARTFMQSNFNSFINFLHSLKTNKNSIYFLARKESLKGRTDLKICEEINQDVVIVTLRV